MFRFRVLGTVELRGPDGERVGSVLSQPKRLALLALLALESPRRLQREEVMGRMWPDMSEERARSALRQALHYLRRSLGSGVVAGKGAEGIGIVPGKLWCDATELLQASGEGRWGDAVEVYQGELLPGFHLDGAPVEFEHWLDSARRRVKQAAAEAALRLAESEESAGNTHAAGAAARKAWEIGDQGEPALQDLLRVLVRTGDLVGAREVYDEFAHYTREAYGVEPSAETRGILLEEGPSPRESVPKLEPVERSARDRRAVAVGSDPVARASVGSTAGGATTRSAAPPLPSKARPTRERWILWWPAAAAAMILSVVALWSVLSRPMEGVEPASLLVADGPVTIGLEPVRDLSAAEELGGVAEAITTELAVRLSAGDGYRVVALSGSDAAAQRSGVRLRPTVRKDLGGDVHVSVLLLDAESGAVLDRVMVNAENGADSSPEAIAGELASGIRKRMGSMLSLRGLAGAGIAPEALSAVRDAAAELADANRLRARGVTEAAVLAYAATDSLLVRASERDPDWPEPTLRRGELALDAMWLHLIPPNVDPLQAHRQILKGLKHAESGVGMAPNSARALEVRGVLRYWAAQTAIDQKREGLYKEEAELDLAQAVKLDPDLPRAWSILSVLSEQRGEFADAYHRARRAYATDHELKVSSDVLVRLFTNALEVGDHEGAAEYCGDIRRQDPDDWLGGYCELMHMAWVGPWDVRRSDSLVEEGLETLAKGGGVPEMESRFRLLRGVIMARAGDRAGARDVLRSVDTASSPSPDVLGLRAWVHTALQERTAAQRLLATAAQMDPDQAQQLLRSRRYSNLASYAVVRRDE